MSNIPAVTKYYKNKLITALPVIALFFVVLITTILFHPEEASELHKHWLTAGNISQGYLLMAAAILLVIINLQRSDFSPSRNHWFLLAALFSILIFTIGKLAFIKLLSLPSIVIIWFCLCGAVFGNKVAKKLRIAAFVMLMAMPAWFIIQPILQGFTVFFVSNVISWLDLTTYIYKNYIEVPSGTIHVAGGCSGIKYFTSAISIALIASAINHRNLRSTLISIAIAASLSILANWIRVLILVLYGYFEGIDHPLMADHDGMGWLVFAIILAPWLFFDRLIPTHHHFQHEILKPFAISNWGKVILWSCIPIVIYAGIGAIYSPRFSQPPYVAEKDIKDLFPGWGKLNPKTTAMFVVQDHDEVQIITDLSACDSRKIGVFSFYSQSQNKEMISSVNSIWDKDFWEVNSIEQHQTPNQSHPVIKAQLQSSSQPTTTIYYWYQVGNHITTTTLGGKLLQLINRIAKNELSRIFIISSSGQKECQITDEELKSYIDRLDQAYLAN